MVVLVGAHGCAIWASGELARRTLAHPNQTASDVVCDALWCGALCDNDCRGIHALFLRDSASIAKCTLVLSLSLSLSLVRSLPAGAPTNLSWSSEFSCNARNLHKRFSMASCRAVQCLYSKPDLSADQHFCRVSAHRCKLTRSLLQKCPAEGGVLQCLHFCLRRRGSASRSPLPSRAT